MDDDDGLFAYIQTMDFPIFDIFLDEIPWEGVGFEDFSPVESRPPIPQSAETSTAALPFAAMEDPALNEPILDPKENNLMENQLLLGEKETEEAPAHSLSPTSPVVMPPPIGQPTETSSSALQEAAVEEEDPAMPSLKVTQFSTRLDNQEGLGFEVLSQPTETSAATLQIPAMENPSLNEQIPPLHRQIQEPVHPLEQESSATVPLTTEQEVVLAAAPIQGLIGDEVHCLSCKRTYLMQFPLKEKLEEMRHFLERNKENVGTEMSGMKLPCCIHCGQNWVTMPSVTRDTPHQHINWPFLFLAKQISNTTVVQMKRFMASNGPFNDPRDRNKLIFQVYQKIYEQLYEHFLL